MDAIEYTIPEPRDAETLMIDPVSKDLIVMAKMQAFIYAFHIRITLPGLSKPGIKVTNHCEGRSRQEIFLLTEAR